MAEQAEPEVEAEFTGGHHAPVSQDRHSHSPAEILRGYEAQGEHNPVDGSFGDRRNNLRERLTKIGLTIAALAGVGALILATHGAAIVPLKALLTTVIHRIPFLNSAHSSPPVDFGGIGTRK